MSETSAEYIEYRSLRASALWVQAFAADLLFILENDHLNRVHPGSAPAGERLSRHAMRQEFIQEIGRLCSYLGDIGPFDAIIEGAMFDCEAKNDQAVADHLRTINNFEAIVNTLSRELKEKDAQFSTSLENVRSVIQAMIDNPASHTERKGQLALLRDMVSRESHNLRNGTSDIPF